MPGRLASAAFAAVLAAPLLVRRGELPVRSEVERLIADSGADVAVAFRTLDGRDKLLIQPDASFHAASTILSTASGNLAAVYSATLAPIELPTRDAFGTFTAFKNPTRNSASIPV